MHLNSLSYTPFTRVELSLGLDQLNFMDYEFKVEQL